MSYTDSIVDAAARLHSLIAGGDSAWTALCGLESTVKRMSGEKAAASLHTMMTLEGLIRGKEDDLQARMIVACEAMIQGICPIQAWEDWDRIHNEAPIDEGFDFENGGFERWKSSLAGFGDSKPRVPQDLIDEVDEDALVPKIYEAFRKEFGEKSTNCSFEINWEAGGDDDHPQIWTDYLWNGEFGGQIFYDGTEVWIIEMVMYSED